MQATNLMKKFVVAIRTPIQVPKRKTDVEKSRINSSGGVCWNLMDLEIDQESVELKKIMREITSVMPALKSWESFKRKMTIETNSDQETWQNGWALFMA